MKSFKFYFPTKIIFGRGRLSDLKSILPEKAVRILVVTDKNIAEQTRIFNLIQSQLDNRLVRFFQNVTENPDFANVEEGARVARDMRADLIIGVGGGSSLDAGKGVALLAVNQQPLRNYVMGGAMPHSPLPVICIPTTAGSGSEATPYAVFTDMQNRTKIGYSNEALFPLVSIIDPELTYSMPAAIAINSGLDAMTHALESYLSTESFMMNDVLALNVIEAVLKNIDAASRKDAGAMEAMAYHAMLAGIVITHAGTILPHIMGYCLTMDHGVPHGRASAALLPAVLDFLREHSTVKDKVLELDKRFSGHGGVRNFIEKLGVSTRISSYGVRPEELQAFTKKVIIKSDILITPARVSDQDILHIYQSAL